MVAGALVLAAAVWPGFTPNRSAQAAQLSEQADDEDTVVELMQTGVGDSSDVVEDRLVFRVRAFDPDEGDDDGDGIAFVDMIILDEDGDEVYRKRETSSGYCAFGGGTPNCGVWDFGNNDGRWPSGELLDEGEHTLRARARADDGQTIMEDFFVDIFLTNGSEDTVVELMQTGVGNSSSVVEDRLVFRVRANDPDEGDDDGDGIAFVDMIILDEDGDEVYRKRETSSGYCAFGGGTPNCGVWDFGNNDDRWPSGELLDEGEHTLRARARADDGQTIMEDFVVDIFLSD
jgi:hypothetical protein